jgi:hypothetical protein
MRFKSLSLAAGLLISGLVNVPLYEIMVRFFYPAVGMGLGTAFALLFSMCTGYLTFIFMKTRLS